jgi:hypothetical protein
MCFQPKSQPNVMGTILRHFKSWLYSMDRSDREIESLEENLRYTRAKLEDAEDKLDGAYGEIRCLNRTLSALDRELEETRVLSDTRRQELSVVEGYFKKVDRASISDVQREVDALNDVFRVEAGNLIPGEVHPFQRSQVCEQETAFLGSVIGSQMLRILRLDLKRDQARFVVTCALRAVLIACVEKLCSSWIFTSHEADRTLVDIYQRMMRSRESTPCF